MTTAPLVLEHLSKRYAPQLPPVVDQLSLRLEAGELLTLLGPSGCGKTTTLRLIAGLEQPDQGQVWLGGQNVTQPFKPPEQRGVGLVFQDYALFPHLSVLGNVLFGLSRWPKEQQLPRAREILGLVGLTVFESRLPHQLSGGQQQRVALARALAPQPKLLLLDEPFSNLDAGLRHSTRRELRAILRQTQTTALLVTHDQEEALALSDRIAVMRSGRIEQLGPPPEVYARPRTAFVANFLGRSNLLSGTANGLQARTALGLVPLDSQASGPVLLSLRPETLRFSRDPEAVSVYIVSREYQGHLVTYTVRLNPKDLGQQELLVQESSAGLYPEGSWQRLEVVQPAHVIEEE